MNTITGVEAIPFMFGVRPQLVVLVTTESGHVGVGESGLTGRELAVKGVVEHLTPLLVGQDANRIEHLWQVMWRSGFFPAQRIAGAAISAIDIALWDLKGKLLGVPVYELLGGAVRDAVDLYPHVVGSRGVDALLDSVAAAVDAGFRYVRWDPPTDGDVFEPRRAIRATLEQMEAVRSRFGEDIEICIDVHTRLDPPDALYLCRESERFRPYFIEDPVRSEDPTTLRHLRAHTAVPLAVGEQYAGKWDFRPLIEERLMDFARIDVCIVGGITETKKIAGWCETHHIRLVTHNPLGAISTAACLHVNVSTTNVAVQEQTFLPEPSDVFPVVPSIVDGRMPATTEPGLGIVFDADAARSRALGGPFALPRLRRGDGSFTNW